MMLAQANEHPKLCLLANRWLFLLESDGLLAVAQKGRRETNKATRFRYSGG